MHSRPLTLNVLPLIALLFFTLIAFSTASAQNAPQVSASLAPSSSGPDPQVFEQFQRYPTEVQNFITMNRLRKNRLHVLDSLQS